MITLRAKLSGAVYCNRSCLSVCVFVGLCVFLWVCYHDNSKLREIEIEIDPRQTGFVGKGIDHLQLIKFWPSRAPGKGVCGGANFLAPPYYSQRCVCVSLSAFSFFIALRRQSSNYGDAASAHQT